MKIGYLNTKETAMRTFFSALPQGNNLFTLWQKFWYVDIEEREGKIDNMTFKLLHIFDPDTINWLVAWLPIAFKSYDIKYRQEPCIIVTMKHKETELDFPTIPKGLIDEVTKTVKTKEQNASFISSLGFTI